MARTAIDWDEIFRSMIATGEGPSATAARFGIARGSVLSACSREKKLPGGGRLAGHPLTSDPDPDAPDPDPDRAPAPAAVYVPLEHLLPWKKNPRRNDRAIVPVADSIVRFGFGAPLLARAADREIIAGHPRLAACHTLPTRYAAASAEERATWHPDAVALASGLAPAGRLAGGSVEGARWVRIEHLSGGSEQRSRTPVALAWVSGREP